MAPKYPETNLKYLLPKLCTLEYGGILRYDSNSGLYSFADPIYRAYALAQFQSKGASNLQTAQGDFEQMLMRLLTEKIGKDGGAGIKIVFEPVARKPAR